MATGFVFHELYLWHDTGTYAQLFPAGLTVQPYEHAENAETKRRLRNLLEVSGALEALTPLKARPMEEDALARFHTRDYIARIRAQSADRGGDAAHLSPFGRGSFEIAQLSAGGVAAAVEAVLTGRVENAYALVRPPGHHAIADRGFGFCLFANAVLAILEAKARHGLGRIATVDWDVHHGNGTQAAFYDRADVLTISLHQDRLFPSNSGMLEERGTGEGEGFNLNVPLPPGCGDAAYVAAIERVVLPALERYRPDLILVPCGFDAAHADPLGRMMVTSEGFRTMARLLGEAARGLCGGRLVLCHEGGYSPVYVPYCGLAVIEELAGLRTGVEDPWLPIAAGWGQTGLQPHQEAAIADAAALVPRIPA